MTASEDAINARRYDDKDDEYEVEEDDEVEEVMDNVPMHITGKLFLGSIDAARNVSALKQHHIGGILALIGKGEEGAIMSEYSSTIDEEDTELQITKTTVEIEDSKHGNLLQKIPGILAVLDDLIAKAERDGTNVLVHCIAGRSRSASALVAWMLVNEPKQQSVQDVVDRVRVIRPWIEINPYFMQDLHLFRAVLESMDGATLSTKEAALLTDKSLPRLDFGVNLIDGVLRGTKTITMRLLTDINDDRNSDLKDIFVHSVVAAKSAMTDCPSTSVQFAYLRIDRIETQELSTIDQATLRKSGFDSSDKVLAVLKQFYPNVTLTTSLLMLYFHCLCPFVL